MKFCIYLLIAALFAASVTQCSSFRATAHRTQTARLRRMEELAE
jgi:hypothetical protein